MGIAASVEIGADVAEGGGHGVRGCNVALVGCDAGDLRRAKGRVEGRVAF